MRTRPGIISSSTDLDKDGNGTPSQRSPECGDRRSGSIRTESNYRASDHCLQSICSSNDRRQKLCLTDDRDPTAPLFKFKTRALVHFAADPDHVYMTTRLARKGTRFLPLNRGSHPGEIQCGAGNPQHPSGYRTGYFWEEVLQRDSSLDLVGNFLFVEKKEEKVVDKDGRARRQIMETLVFPRYHQLDSVRKLVQASQTEKSARTT